MMMDISNDIKQLLDQALEEFLSQSILNLSTVLSLIVPDRISNHSKTDASSSVVALSSTTTSTKTSGSSNAGGRIVLEHTIPPNSRSSEKMYMNVLIDMDGFLIQSAKMEVKFNHRVLGSVIQCQLSDPLKTPWILEQLVAASNYTKIILSLLSELQKSTLDGRLVRNEDHYKVNKTRLDDELYTRLFGFLSKIDHVKFQLAQARNCFILPNPSGFPQTFRPFVAFTPALPSDVIVEFNIFRDRLLVSAMTVNHIGADQRPDYQAITRDSWFHEDSPDLVGKKFVFKQRTIEVVEQQILSFSVPWIAKSLTLLNDTYEEARNLHANITAILKLDDRFKSSVWNDRKYDTETLVQPTLLIDQDEGGFIF